jgi:hypothetical protein
MTESSFDLIKKHGATGVLFLWLIVTNMKVNEIENRLFDCLEDSAQAMRYDKTNKRYETPNQYFAILQDKKNKYANRKRHIKA